MRVFHCVLVLLVFASVWGCGEARDGDDADVVDGGRDARDGFVPDADEPDVDTGDGCLRMFPIRLWTTEPSAVGMLYRVETCEGRPITLVPTDASRLSEFYSLSEDGVALSSEAAPQIRVSGPQRAYVTLLLDLSSSTRVVIDDVIDAAVAFAESAVSASARIRVGIDVFDGRPDSRQEILPTRDVAALREALVRLAAERDPDADEGSTNLHGGIATSVFRLQDWQSQVVGRNRGGLATSGYVVAFTDGEDTASRVPLERARDVVDAAQAARGTSGERANVQTFAVAMRGDDFTAAARDALVNIVGDEARVYEGEVSELTAQFQELASRIGAEVEAMHLLTYCSASRSGTREVSLAINSSLTSEPAEVRFSIATDGFGPGCREFAETVCETSECGGFNCGACDDASGVCTTEGECVDACLAASRCSGEVIETDLGYLLDCSPERLGESVQSCAGACRDLSADSMNCGACGNTCPAETRCSDGRCACDGGGAVCGGECRPESFFATEANCGACGNVCRDGNQCVDGVCTCPEDWQVCYGQCLPASFFESRPMDCGSCGNRCASALECIDGACACETGSVLCAGECQPDDYFLSSSEHCGACGVTCSAACRDGSCDDVRAVRASDVLSRLRGNALTTRGGLYSWNGTSSSSARPLHRSHHIRDYYEDRRRTCFTVPSGELWCRGQGLGDTARTTEFVRIEGVTAQRIKGHSAFICVLTDDQEVWCWEHGGSVLPERIISNVQEFDVGAQACAVRTDGQVHCWSMTGVDSVFRGGAVERIRGFDGSIDVAVGSDYVCAVQRAGTVSCFGNGRGRVLGTGDERNAAEPVASVGVTGAQEIEVATDLRQVCVARRDDVMCWGTHFLLPTVAYEISVSGLDGGPQGFCGVGTDESEQLAYCWDARALGFPTGFD